MIDCTEMEAHTPADLFSLLDREFPEQWVFRGQYSEHSLETKLERACNNWNIKYEDRPGLEEEMVREFQRWYDGNDKDDVRNDTLYCLSLMQHYGAPTRLLDWTYSNFVAAYFAFESAKNNKKIGDKRSFIIWCLNPKWCERASASKEIMPATFVQSRGDDVGRKDDSTFTRLYKVGKKEKPYPFVLAERPFRFHNRLYAQQAIFVCPGDITIPFENNLTSLKDWGKRESLVKVKCEMVDSDLEDGLMKLWRMNISRATLFPGLQGFAEAMMYRLALLKKISYWRQDIDS